LLPGSWTTTVQLSTPNDGTVHEAIPALLADVAVQVASGVAIVRFVLLYSRNVSGAVLVRSGEPPVAGVSVACNVTLAVVADVEPVEMNIPPV
jgi:hypothetical protein